MRYHQESRGAVLSGKYSNDRFIQTQTVELDLVFGHPLQFSLPRANGERSHHSLGRKVDGIAVMNPTLELTADTPSGAMI